MAMRGTRRRGAAWLACAATALATAPAAAQAPAEAKQETADPKIEEARDAFRIGNTLAKQAQWTEALSAFERSARLRPHAVTTYNIGFCERALGHYTRAKRSLTRALAAPGNELPEALAAEARGYLAEIEHRLSRAVVTLSRPGATVSVDGRPLEAAGGKPSHPELVAGTREPGPAEPVGAPVFDLFIDPGTHVIVVGVPGAADTVVTREFTPGATLSLAVGPAEAAATPKAPPPPPAGGSGRRTGAIVSFALGGAFAIAGGTFGGLALKDKSALDGLCVPKNRCPASAQGTIDGMNTFATVSTITLGAALAGVGVGVVLLVTSGGAAPRAPAAAISPWIGPGSAGLRGSF
jgi:hypothetical protein